MSKFAVNNHEVDGTQTLISRNRDYDWKQGKRDSAIAQNWNQVAQGTLHWQLVASDTITAGLQRFWLDIVKEACPNPNNQNKFVPCEYIYDVFLCLTGGC